MQPVAVVPSVIVPFVSVAVVLIDGDVPQDDSADEVRLVVTIEAMLVPTNPSVPVCGKLMPAPLGAVALVTRT